jgi:3-oxoacyl-[acyl-carrier-protein] synthase-3
MTDVFVDHFEYSLGEQIYTVEESGCSGRLFSRARDLADAGFSRHHVSAPGTTAYDLAKRCTEKLAPHLSDVDAIVYSTCLPANGNVGDPTIYALSRDVKHVMDFPASRLQSDFGLERAFVVGLNQQACTGMLGALRLSRALIIAEPEISKILCITADRFPDGAAYEQAYNLISDGAAGCVVSREAAGFRLLASQQLTNGALAVITDDEVVGTYFSYTRAIVSATLRAAGLTPADVTWVVPQNTNRQAWKIMARVLSFREEQVMSPSMPDAGHIISGDNIVNLRLLVDSGSLKSGDVLLLVMAGYGMNWQCTLLETL